MSLFTRAPLSVRHVARATALAAVIAFALAACSGAPEGTPTSSSPSETLVPSSTPSADAPTPSPESTTELYPVGKTCEDLVGLQALYDFNPNFAYDSSRLPESGSEAEKLTSMMGVSCTYVNLSSGIQIVLGVAKRDEKGLSEARTFLEARGTQTPGAPTPPSVASFFAISGGVGTLDILTNTYWISVSSPSFASPEDTSHFVAALLPSLS